MFQTFVEKMVSQLLLVSTIPLAVPIYVGKYTIIIQFEHNIKNYGDNYMDSCNTLLVVIVDGI